MKPESRPPQVGLLGTPGPWPFAGHLRGRLHGAGGALSWAGRVAASRGPQVAYQASRAVEAALRQVAHTGDRRRVLADAWLALDGLRSAALGPDRGADLVLLLVAVDEEGAAISGVGLDHIMGGGAELRLWLRPPHPLLGPPGLPGAQRGALSVDTLPPWLIAVAADAPPVTGLTLPAALRACGVHR